jgi:hypothetical protein
MLAELALVLTSIQPAYFLSTDLRHAAQIEEFLDSGRLPIGGHRKSIQKTLAVMQHLPLWARVAVRDDAAVVGGPAVPITACYQAGHATCGATAVTLSFTTLATSCPPSLYMHCTEGDWELF